MCLIQSFIDKITVNCLKQEYESSSHDKTLKTKYNKQKQLMCII